MADSIDISATSEGSSDPRLRIELVNRTGRPLSVYEHSLPWKGWQNLLLIAAKIGPPGVLLKRELPVDDPGPGVVNIAPEETLRGEIALARRFPTIGKALRADDVMVFWSYQFRSTDLAALPRTGGWVLLPKISGERRLRR
jgi:hypothetical protein